MTVMMNENDNAQDFNRRDFLKSGSVATLMTMLGGVELFAQTNGTGAGESKYEGPRLKVAVIGLGAWGRELVNTLALMPEAEVAAVCDTYPASLRRAGTAAPGAAKTADYKTILANKDIKAVIIATPTHQHKEIALEALKAGKHVYCEAPLANTIEDARAIASAGKAAKQLVFQGGLQMRADPQRHFLLPFIRSGALGKFVMARAQWHKKQSWRATSPNPEHEKELNWRLDKNLSLGLAGETGIHSIDQATWFFDSAPAAVSGLGTITLWNDGRNVDDTIQALLEFPAGVFMTYNATLANSFDGAYEMLYGSDSAIMLRESKAWLFKEVDSPLLGWEVYARKEEFYKETGIALVANASKAVVPTGQSDQQAALSSPIFYALKTFVLNAADVSGATEDYTGMFGADDVSGLMDHLAKVPRRQACDYLTAFKATVTAIKTNEAINQKQRLVLQPDWYELS